LLHRGAERAARRARAVGPDDGVTGLRVVAPVGEVDVPDDHEAHVAERPGDAHAFGEPGGLVGDGDGRAPAPVAGQLAEALAAHVAELGEADGPRAADAAI